MRLPPRAGIPTDDALRRSHPLAPKCTADVEALVMSSREIVSCKAMASR